MRSGQERARATKLHRRAVPRVLVAMACVAAVSAAGCTEPTEAAREDRLVVFAAASLRDGFATLGEEFERSHPGVAITFNFAGSQELRTQHEHGAAADVFASAAQRHMCSLVRSARVTGPTVFARTEPLVVAARDGARMERSLAMGPGAQGSVADTPEV